MLAWHTAVFSRLGTLKPVEDYLRPERHTVMFDDDNGLEAALDRVVVQHAVIADPSGQTTAGPDSN